MPIKSKLPSVRECISYIESLGYKCIIRTRGYYVFEVIDRSTRPIHNWQMKWNLNEMRHAVKNGC